MEIDSLREAVLCLFFLLSSCEVSCLFSLALRQQGYHISGVMFIACAAKHAKYFIFVSKASLDSDTGMPGIAAGNDWFCGHVLLSSLSCCKHPRLDSFGVSSANSGLYI